MTSPAPTCAHCNYSRAGLADSAPCPECGRAFVPATGLAAQPRRVRWCWLIGGLLLAASPFINWTQATYVSKYIVTSFVNNMPFVPIASTFGSYNVHFGSLVPLTLLSAALALLCIPLCNRRAYWSALNTGAFALTLLTLLAAAVILILSIVLALAAPASAPQLEALSDLLKYWDISLLVHYACHGACIWIFFAAWHLRSRTLCWCTGIVMCGVLADLGAFLALRLSFAHQQLSADFLRGIWLSAWLVTLIATLATGLTCAWLAWRALRKPRVTSPPLTPGRSPPAGAQ